MKMNVIYKGLGLVFMSWGAFLLWHETLPPTPKLRNELQVCAASRCGEAEHIFRPATVLVWVFHSILNYLF